MGGKMEDNCRKIILFDPERLFCNDFWCLGGSDLGGGSFRWSVASSSTSLFCKKWTGVVGFIGRDMFLFSSFLFSLYPTGISRGF